jgi:hypothetical protein
LRNIQFTDVSCARWSGRCGRLWRLTVGVVSLVCATLAWSTAPVEASPTGFVPITPVRALDTRSPKPQPFGPGAERVLSLSGIVPAGATGVALNVTAVAPTTSTYLTVWPGGRGRPLASNVNVVAGQTRPNAVLVGVSSNRSVSLFNFAGNTHVLVDVMGYFVGGFNGVTPTRLMDTRIGRGAGTFGPGVTAELRVGGVGGVPVGAAAVAVNITAVNATERTYLTAWPSGRTRPATSNVNTASAAAAPNMAVVALDRNGAMKLFNFAGRVDVLVDVMGWFDADSGYVAVGPNRLLDTRRGTCGFRLGAGETRTLAVTTKQNVTAVGLNVTAVNPSARTFLTVWPTGQKRPPTSNLNVAAGQTPTPNFVTVGVGTAGQVQIFNSSGTIDVIVDVVASFAGTTPTGSPTPCPTAPASGGSSVINPLAKLHRSVGTDTIATYVCRVPLSTTDSYYRQYGADRLVISPADVSNLGNTEVAPFFRSMSRGRYQTNFIPAGFIDLNNTDGPSDCFFKAARITGAPFTNMVVSDNAGNINENFIWGFGSGGKVSSDASRHGLHLINPPSATLRGSFVTGTSIVAWRHPEMMTHEVGHTLLWPHSHRSARNEYDNPLDLMSGAQCSLNGGRRRCRTLAYNRLTAGWINDNEVDMHRSGTRTVTLVGPDQNGIALLAALSGDPNLFVTLEARPGSGPDAGLESPGVAIHVIDQRVSSCRDGISAVAQALGACPFRRQGQAVGRGNTFDHVLSPGRSITLNGLTITVGAATANGYVVTVTGTFDHNSFAWPITLSSVIETLDQPVITERTITEYGPDTNGDGTPDWERRIIHTALTR